jgi:hypothetical protein
MAMAGAKRFLWFRWSGDLLPEDGMGSSLEYGIHKANCVMAEADVMVVSRPLYCAVHKIKWKQLYGWRPRLGFHLLTTMYGLTGRHWPNSAICRRGDCIGGRLRAVWHET